MGSLQCLVNSMFFTVCPTQGVVYSMLITMYHDHVLPVGVFSISLSPVRQYKPQQHSLQSAASHNAPKQVYIITLNCGEIICTIHSKTESCLMNLVCDNYFSQLDLLVKTESDLLPEMIVDAWVTTNFKKCIDDNNENI